MRNDRFVFSTPIPSSGASRSLRGTWFSLGTVLAVTMGRSGGVMPWVATAGTLALLACADFVSHGGNIDFIMLGLACYELLIGLTED